MSPGHSGAGWSLGETVLLPTGGGEGGDGKHRQDDEEELVHDGEGDTKRSSGDLIQASGGETLYTDHPPSGGEHSRERTVLITVICLDLC